MEATKLLKSIIAMTVLASSAVFATGPTSGQLVIINSMGNVDTSGVPGVTASSMSVVVTDGSGSACSTTSTVAYNGTVTVKWNSSAAHSATSCTSIASVAVTPLKTTVGSQTTIVYDSVTSTTIPATTATAAISFTPPTTAYANLALIVTGNGVPASAVTATATVWGVGAADAPAFDTTNGALTTVGVPGANGTYGLKAAKIMRQYGIIPFASNSK